MWNRASQCGRGAYSASAAVAIEQRCFHAASADVDREEAALFLIHPEGAAEVRQAARAFLAREGYDPQFGARPLKRSIQEHLLDPLAMKLLDGEIKPGDRIAVTGEDGRLTFTPRK
mgnify:CR=1 FL=1